jgi:hypothetical protein
MSQALAKSTPGWIDGNVKNGGFTSNKNENQTIKHGG